MKKTRNRRQSLYSHDAIAAKIIGRNGKPVFRQQVGRMLNNPDAGQNRARLTAALIEMGLTKEGAEMFIGVKQSDEK